jgi:hypothetical protein
MRSIACMLLLVAVAVFPRAVTAQATASGPGSTKSEPPQASTKPQPSTPESTKTKKAAGSPRGGGPFDPMTIALGALSKIENINRGVEELKKNANDQKQGNLYLEAGLAAVATLGLLFGLAALWQTTRLQKQLLALKAQKRTEVDL